MDTRSFHPYLRDGWAGPVAARAGAVLPDVNPADEAVARLRRKFGDEGAAGGLRGLDGSGSTDGDPGAGGTPGNPGAGGGRGGGGGSGGGIDPGTFHDLEASVATMTDSITALTDRLNSASAVCNGDGTITFTV